MHGVLLEQLEHQTFLKVCHLLTLVFNTFSCVIRKLISFSQSKIQGSLQRVMDLQPFKLDIDELINDFSKGKSTVFAEFKRIWLSKKFSFIFEAGPSTNQACFMQSLYAHTIGYMVPTGSLSNRVGGLYCLYCLYETQPFRPPFRIYLSVGDLMRLRNLVADAKKRGIKVVSNLVKRMLDNNVFLFGAMDVNEGSATERINEVTRVQNARVQAAYKLLFAKTELERFIRMDLGKELDVKLLKKEATEYTDAKERSIREASKVINVENIEHIAENDRPIGDTLEKIAVDWNLRKESFCQQTGYGYGPAAEPPRTSTAELHAQQSSNESMNPNDIFGNMEIHEQNKFEKREQNNDDFGKELEAMLSQSFESDNEATEDIEHSEED